MDLLTREDIEKITWEVVNTFLIPDFERRNHNASGKWLASLNVNVDKNKSVIRGQHYSEYLVTGSKPQQKNDHDLAMWARWAGKNVFEDWVQNKGLNLNPYAVAYSIAKHGSKIYREGGSDFLEILQSDEVRDFIIDKIRPLVSVRVKGILLEKIKQL